MEHVVKIEALTYGDAAIAHTADGKAVFVPATAPGDTVRIEIIEDRPNFARARVLELLEPSPERIVPACPWAEVCGGCQWMHLPYETQLYAKRNHVLDALERIAHVPASEAANLVEDIIPSKRQLGYRNKLELGIGRDGQGRLVLGFYSEASHDIVPIESCLLVHKGIQKAPKALRGALRFVEGKQDLGIYRIGVRHSEYSGNLELALWTPPSGFPRAQVAATLSSGFNPSGIVRVLADPGHARKIKKTEVLDGFARWKETLLDNEFLISAPSFFQVNTEAAEEMIQCVLEGLEVDENTVVADLYSGAGTFSIPLGQRANVVYAIEAAASSVRDLRLNAERNDVWVEVIGGDAAREMSDLGGLDALVVDPPRAGLAENMPALIEKAAPRLFAYVSCNPTTWARDVARLSQHGYALRRATPIDLFPQTYHVEVVSIFERNR